MTRISFVRLALSFGFPVAARRLDEAVEKARIAEALGVHSIWVGESAGRDAFQFLGRIAAGTTRIGLGTAVIPLYGRSPAAIAMAAATLDEMCGGRFMLGLGSGTEAFAGWHGERWHRDTVGRMREAVAIIRAVWRREPLRLVGRHWTLDGGLRLQFRPPREQAPILIGGVGPAMIRLAGEIADGWIPTFWAMSALAPAVNDLERARAMAGRPEPPPIVAPFTFFLPADDLDSGRARVRTWAEGYFRRPGPYSRLMERQGFGDEMAAALSAPTPEARRAALSDRLIDDVCIVGDAARCRLQLARRYQEGATLPMLLIPEGSPDQFGQILESLAQQEP